MSNQADKPAEDLHQDGEGGGTAETGKAVCVRKTGSFDRPFALVLGTDAAGTAAGGAAQRVPLTEDESIALLLNLADANGLQLLFFDFLNQGEGNDDPTQPMEARVARARECSPRRITERAAEIGEHELLRRIFGSDVEPE
jgi:hypothetical protein